MKKNSNKSKLGIVWGIHPENYEIFDQRINKPICHKKFEKGIETSSMVFHELDSINFKNNNLSYLSPNNVGVLLSIAKKALDNATAIYNEKINPDKTSHSIEKADKDKKEFIIEKSKTVCDYIESIQTSIVFSYTALEAFSNLSIPINYKYSATVEHKGIVEVYDKQAIEKWMPLKEKLAKILPEIYETSKIEKKKYWSYYLKLEKYRHNIIHQKSIDRTEFYKTYFNKDIFFICRCAEEIIKYYYEQHAEKNKVNPLWPWLINKEKEFPVNADFNSNNFEVVGNLYEGIKKNKKNI